MIHLPRDKQLTNGLEFGRWYEKCKSRSNNNANSNMKLTNSESKK